MCLRLRGMVHRPRLPSRAREPRELPQQLGESTSFPCLPGRGVPQSSQHPVRRRPRRRAQSGRLRRSKPCGKAIATELRQAAEAGTAVSSTQAFSQTHGKTTVKREHRLEDRACDRPSLEVHDQRRVGPTHRRAPDGTRPRLHMLGARETRRQTSPGPRQKTLDIADGMSMINRQIVYSFVGWD